MICTCTRLYISCSYRDEDNIIFLCRKKENQWSNGIFHDNKRTYMLTPHTKEKSNKKNSSHKNDPWFISCEFAKYFGRNPERAGFFLNTHDNGQLIIGFCRWKFHVRLSYDQKKDTNSNHFLANCLIQGIVGKLFTISTDFRS